VTYLSRGNKLELYYDGKLADSKDVSNSVGNNGPLYIGKDPWYNGVVGAGLDNIQIHTRALSKAEISRCAAG
jgi:hypothetical protein